MRKIIYSRSDGGISIVSPCLNLNDPEGFTEADAERRAWDKLPADAISPRWAGADELLTDRTFRNAWKSDLTVDMTKARDIHKDRLRAIRAPLFVTNDLAIQDALVSGDAQALAAAKAKRDALRDVTADPAIGSAKTPDELKAVLPAALR